MATFSVIQTHLPRHFYLTVDFFGLRRNGSSSWIIPQVRYLLEQALWHGDFRHLERELATMTDHLRTDLHQLFPQRGERPVFHLLRQRKRPHEVAQIVGPGVKLGRPDSIGVLRGLIHTPVSFGPWKEKLMADPANFVEAYIDRTRVV